MEAVPAFSGGFQTRTDCEKGGECPLLSSIAGDFLPCPVASALIASLMCCGVVLSRVRSAMRSRPEMVSGERICFGSGSPAQPAHGLLEQRLRSCSSVLPTTRRRWSRVCRAGTEGTASWHRADEGARTHRSPPVGSDRRSSSQRRSSSASKRSALLAIRNAGNSPARTRRRTVSGDTDRSSATALVVNNAVTQYPPLYRRELRAAARLRRDPCCGSRPRPPLRGRGRWGRLENDEQGTTREPLGTSPEMA